MHKQQLLLKPCAAVNQAVQYIIAVLCDRYGILLHALTALSNHKHDASTDPRGMIVGFQRDCHQLIARCVNAYFGDTESMWSRHQTNRVTCVEPSDIIGKIAYTLANPTTSYLVEKSSSWPGVRAAWPAKPRVVRRPWWFFRDEEDGGEWPEKATLRFHRPPGFDSLSDEELAEKIAAATAALEEKARAEVREKGGRFFGRRAIRRQTRYDYPSSREATFGIVPHVAAKSKSARIARLESNQVWLEQYDDALERYRAGDHSAVFPYGTYEMRVLYDVRCRPPPS